MNEYDVRKFYILCEHSDSILGGWNNVEVSMDVYAKEMAVGFFKWNAENIATYLHYIKEIRKQVVSNEIEESIVNYEGATIEERYNMYIEYLKTLPIIQEKDR